jgi:hypothetical protein
LNFTKRYAEPLIKTFSTAELEGSLEGGDFEGDPGPREKRRGLM